MSLAQPPKKKKKFLGTNEVFCLSCYSITWDEWTICFRRSFLDVSLCASMTTYTCIMLFWPWKENLPKVHHFPQSLVLSVFTESTKDTSHDLLKISPGKVLSFCPAFFFFFISQWRTINWRLISLLLHCTVSYYMKSKYAAAAAAKSLQSCPTLCDPRDGSSPGSPVPGILQARTLEWVAISFSNAWKWKVKGKSLSRALT